MVEVVENKGASLQCLATSTGANTGDRESMESTEGSGPASWSVIVKFY